MAKSQKFSVRLLKEEYDFTKACKNIDDLELIVQDDIYSVYLCPDNPQTPWWKGFLGIDRELYNHSNSAI